ncbi:MAG: PaaI family thioesterase [Acidobacteriota bacterium]
MSQQIQPVSTSDSQDATVSGAAVHSTDDEIRTHEAIDHTISGEPVWLAQGKARLRWWALDSMRADDSGLVHGGFVFSLADHAAMLAVNHPNVVLGASDCRFLAPVAVGETLEAVASLARVDGKKHHVDVTVRRADLLEESVDGGTEAAGEEVFRGSFTCFVPPRHVLADAVEATAQ